MTAPALLSRDAATVKAALVQSFADALEPALAHAAEGQMSPRQAEQQAWSVLLLVGPLLLTALFGALCRNSTEGALSQQRLEPSDVKMRFDRDYWVTLMTTLGAVRFPWFAFVHQHKVSVPAREVFPLASVCKSSEVCLEWETALAADHPFRRAATALGFFTHGAVALADNTLERHAVLVGQHIESQWLYATPQRIREILDKQATRDKNTGKPIIYVSTDAHALRMLTGETWQADWKMHNGIRMWCIDGKTGALVHLGGEYIRGDCHATVARFTTLRASGHLPKDGDYGEGVLATITLVTDGLEWIGKHVVPLFPDAVHILDPYHVVEQVADAASTLFPGQPKRAKRLVRRARAALGIRDRRPRTHYRKGPRRRLHKTRHVPFRGSGAALLEELSQVVPVEETAKERLATLTTYVTTNLYRIHYGDLRNRGFQIGSGAMESMHRQGSQLRMKRSGCRWTPGVAHAILQVRMLALSGRWDEWWQTPGRAAHLASAGHAT